MHWSLGLGCQMSPNVPQGYSVVEKTVKCFLYIKKLREKMPQKSETSKKTKKCFKGELSRGCTLVYSRRILQYLLYSAFKYQKYDLKSELKIRLF